MSASGTSLVTRIGVLFFALLTNDHAPKRTDDADERSAVGAWVALGCALLLATGATDHRITLAEYLAHHSTGAAQVERLEMIRTGQSTSRPAFHNALGCLQPAREAVGTCFLPTVRHRSQSPFFPIALETQPAVAVLAGDGDVSPKRATTALGGAASVRETLRQVARPRGCATVNLPSLRGGGRNHPHLPPSSR